MALPGDPEPESSEGKPTPAPSLVALTQTVEELERRVEALEARLQCSPGPSEAAPVAEAIHPTAEDTPREFEDESSRFILVLALAGRIFLIFAGAFLIRAITDAGKLPPRVGALTGLAYAAAWAIVAARTRKASAAPAAFALTAAGIAFPLIWEATTRFAVFSASGAAIALLSTTTLILAVAWRRELQTVAWVVVMATLVSGFGLMIATTAIQVFTALFLALGIGILWLTYGRRWAALRWPTAFAADLAILILGLLAAWPGGPPEAYRGLSIPLAFAQCLSLLVLYLGSFGLRTLQRNRSVIPFEGVQASLAVLVGFGGAIRIAASTGTGMLSLGLAALAAGTASYAVAFAFVERRAESGLNFLFYTSLALVFILTGVPTLFHEPFRTGLLAALGLVAGVLAVRHSRTTLHSHSALYLAAACLASGYLAQGMKAFLGLPPDILRASSLSRLPLLLTLAMAHVVLLRTRPTGDLPFSKRIPSLILALLTVFGIGAFGITAIARSLPPDYLDQATAAALRTGVLSISAMLLAAISRVVPIPEHRWLVYPILGVTALKLLLEDLPQGRPLTLFPALSMFGIALILVPRLMRREGRKPPISQP